jgi:hypothetical protein
MRGYFKIAFLVLLIVFLSLLTVKQSIKIFDRLKIIEMPTKQSRNLSELGIYNIMTVKELSLKYNLREEEIFKKLNIVPEQEDSLLTLKELRKKYKKTPEEFQRELKLIVETDRKAGNTNE